MGREHSSRRASREAPSQRTPTTTLSSSSSSLSTPMPRRPLQYGISNNDHHQQQPTIVRQTPPSARMVATPARSNNRQFRHYHYRQQIDSPFNSPLPSNNSASARPLVLDPTQSTPTSQQKQQQQQQQQYSRNPVVHKILEAARGIRDQASPAVNLARTSYEQRLANETLIAARPTAASLARAAPQAGFLHKLGMNIPEFKRRFFILKPCTYLYYYLSPNDTEPRGCMDLEGSEIEEIEETPDGRFRFTVKWQDKQIFLEARSRELGEEWMGYLQRERVSTLKHELERAQNENLSHLNHIKDLERQIEDFKMVEKDRDGALEDAERWKSSFEHLDEALRLLTQTIRRPPGTNIASTTTSASVQQSIRRNQQYMIDNNEEKKDTGVDNEQDEQQTSDQPPNLITQQTATATSSTTTTQRDSSLLDTSTEEDHVAGDIWDVPGTYFPALSNACQQLQENWRLASTEASTAIDDLKEANDKLALMETRMEKAEKHLCKLWEENCSIRKTLKQKKRERRVLVREVKALQKLVAEEKTGEPTIPDTLRLAQNVLLDQEESALATDNENLIEVGTDEERLINELEEHVASTIKLHEKFLAGGKKRNDNRTKNSYSSSNNNNNYNNNNNDNNNKATTVPAKTDEAKLKTTNSATLRFENNVVSYPVVNGNRMSPLQPKLLSLFDTSKSDDDNDDDDNDDDNVSKSDAHSQISSVGAEMGDTSDCDNLEQSIHSQHSNTPERPNPLKQLDQNDESRESRDQFMTELPPQRVITKNGQATSRLVCPLADVVETNNNKDIAEVTPINQELEVYHLTFHSRKIGLQFMRVPPPPPSSKGLLTDAMTADLVGDPNGSGKTAAELRGPGGRTKHKIQTHHKSTREDFCEIATPRDAVLVCGFDGFNDSGASIRPKLGARLVAFDGISVEVGNWTFDAIRKAIQARRRPLTLSFRNDFLTTRQRAALTKAVSENDKSRPHIRNVPSHISERPPSVTPSISSAISHETDHFVNEEDNVSTTNECDLSASVTSGSTCWHRRIRSGSSSVSTGQGNIRSFSEAGSSSISAAFAPLMANLLKSVNEPREKFTPDYMLKDQATLDDKPQHQDFHTNLL